MPQNKVKISQKDFDEIYELEEVPKDKPDEQEKIEEPFLTEAEQAIDDAFHQDYNTDEEEKK